MKQIIVDLGCGNRKRTKGGLLVGTIGKVNCGDVLRSELGRFPTDAELEESWETWNLEPVIGINEVKTKQTDIVCRLGYEKIPLEDESVDYVLAHDLVEHLPFVDGKKRPVAYLFEEVFRVLKPGAYFEILVPIFPHYDKFKFFNPHHKSYWGTETIHIFASKFKFCGARLSGAGKQHILLMKYD